MRSFASGLLLLGLALPAAGEPASVMIEDLTWPEVLFLDKDRKWIRRDNLVPREKANGVDGDPRQASAELGNALSP